MDNQQQDEQALLDQREADKRLRSAEQELRELELYRNGHFALAHPIPVLQEVAEPVKKELTFFRMMGISAVALILTGIGAIIFQAIRTAAILSGAEYQLLQKLFPGESWTQGLSLVAGGCVLFAVEGFIAAWGYNKGVQSGRLNENPWAFRAAMAITILAGLLSTFPLVDESEISAWIENALTWFMVAFTGVGVPTLIWVGSENLGFLHNAWKKRVRDIYAEYKNACLTAQSNYDVAMRLWSAELEKEFYAQRSKVFGRRSDASRAAPAPAPVTKVVDSVQTVVAQWLADHQLTAHDVGAGKAVQPSQIATELQIADSGAVRTALSRLRGKP